MKNLKLYFDATNNLKIWYMHYKDCKFKNSFEEGLYAISKHNGNIEGYMPENIENILIRYYNKPEDRVKEFIREHYKPLYRRIIKNVEKKSKYKKGI